MSSDYTYIIEVNWVSSLLRFEERTASVVIQERKTSVIRALTSAVRMGLTDRQMILTCG